MWVGEALIGDGCNRAHTNLLLGSREGPVGTAMAVGLATPRGGHAPFLAVLRPNVLVKPATLFVNKIAIESERHGEMTWGPAQIGLAAGIAEALEVGLLNPQAVDHWAIIAAVFVATDAESAEVVFLNNKEAAVVAMTRALNNEPTADQVLDAVRQPGNRFFNPAL
jgi:5,6,7,8-tetrahydromethanopterin hydro-lyase